MFRLISIAAVVSLFLLGTFAFSQENPRMPPVSRIIRAEKPDQISEDGITPAIQVVGVFIGDQKVELNRSFAMDDEWLRNLRVRVRNVSHSSLPCVGIGFGLLTEMDTKLEPYQSWPWGISFKKGRCGKTDKTGTNFRLKAGAE